MNGTMRPLALLVAVGTGLPGPAQAQDSFGDGPPRAWIGILTETTTLAEDGSRAAILVTDVFVNGPAYLGGMLPGDVVFAVNGVPLAAYDSWLNAVAGLEPGQPLRVGLWRGDDEIDVTIIADRRPVMRLARLDTIQARVSRSFDSIMRMYGAQPSDSVIMGFTSTSERLLQWEARVQVSWQRTTTVETTVAEAAPPGSAEERESLEERRADLEVAREEAELRAVADQSATLPVAGGGGDLRAVVEIVDAVSTPGFAPLFMDRPVVLGGAQVRSLTSELGGFFGVEAGVLVTDVLHQSAAARADFRPGDVIVAVAGGAVASLAQLRTALALADLPTVVTVVRRGSLVDLTYPARQAGRGPIGSE